MELSCLSNVLFVNDLIPLSNDLLQGGAVQSEATQLSANNQRKLILTWVVSL